MHPSKVNRAKLSKLTDLPNIGKAGAADLMRLGINNPQDLLGRDPQQLYHHLCDISQLRHDPCVLDVLMSVVRFMRGEAPRPWWEYTAERKLLFGSFEKK